MTTRKKTVHKSSKAISECARKLGARGGRKTALKKRASNLFRKRKK